MKKLVLIGILYWFGSTGYLVGQEGWIFSGEVRHRFEFNDRDFNSTTKPSNYNFLRSRLGLTFTPLKDVTTFFQLQDSRIMGEELSTLTDGSADQLDLHQVYFKVDKIFSLPADLQVGRMAVSFGPQRFLGAVNWHNVGRSFDGVMLNVHSERVNSRFFNLKQVEKIAPGDTGDVNVIGNYTNVKLLDNYITQAFLIWQKTVPSSVLNRFTGGFYIYGQQGKVEHTLEGAYQTGKITPTDANEAQDVTAFFGAYNGKYSFGNYSSIKPSISLGVAYLSGDDNLSDGSYKAFDTMYSTNHKYYGSMDYFTNIPDHTGRRGLVDSHLKISFIPVARTKVTLAYHDFKSAEKYVFEDHSSAKDFGNEIDLTLKHQYNNSFFVVAGFSTFSPGEIFKQTKGKDSSNWFFLMSSVKF